MQKEYKESMEKISLSDSSRARILANVKKACDSGEMPPSQTVLPVSRFSPRRIAAMAAAFVVILVSAALLRIQFMGGGGEGDLSRLSDPSPSPEVVVWEELDSIDDIEKKTECKTYTLGNLSKKYKVRRVQVAREQKHVKIIYRNEKNKDRILFEYKEEENAPDVMGQFEEETELAMERVDGSDVKMYGVEKCDGMTWQKEATTFAVRMSQGRTKEQAKKIVSETREKKPGEKEDGDDMDSVHGDASEPDRPSGAVGWSGDEKETGTAERRNILKKIYSRLGFRVTVEKPAKRVSYKRVGDFESFAFFYNANEDLAGQRIVGYAGWEGCPDGVMDGFEESDSIQSGGLHARIYRKDNEEVLLSFTKQGVALTILLENWTEEKNISTALAEISSVLHVSMDSGETDEDDGDETPEEESERERVTQCQKAAQKLQDAVAEGSLRKMAAFGDFPIRIKGGGEMISIADSREFLALAPETIFTADWVDAVVSYSTGAIDADTKTFTMGDDSNSLTCMIRDNTVVFTELYVSGEEPTASATPAPADGSMPVAK